MTLGTALVLFAAASMLFGLIRAMTRDDIYDATQLPTYRDIEGSLRSAGKLPSSWKSVNKDNQSSFAVMAFCLIGLIVLFFTYPYVIRFVDQF
ncbi:hypothetical protein [Mesorhizobium sp. IMUNJ 23232]|uniref:hypothetical protein n=1 Tax=Mesorhizobium sp. IMUNJ 23232 TaxID=3376064 RepID=UPI00378ECEC0